MSEIKFFELKCQRCGGELERRIESGAEIYVCQSCERTFEKQVVSDIADQLRSVLDEQNQEAVANLRRQLWAEMHEQYINSAKIVELSRGIKKYLPDDYFANFCEIANSGNDRQVNAFLKNISKANMADYADVVLDFMLKSLKSTNITELTNFIEKAFSSNAQKGIKGDPQNYDKYTTKLETEAEKVNSGIYELTLTRDVFLAYSSADMDRVIELCEFLESNGLTCFLALRNLRHGREAVDNYDNALKTAIDNCKTVVFVSSTNSRSLSCDALTKELPYIKQKDLEAAPPEFKRAYDRLPQEYMMPRVEYLIDDYTNSPDSFVAQGQVKEFFHGLEWCKSKEAVARRVTKYITEVHETTAQRAKTAKSDRADGITQESFNGKKLCKKCKKSINLTAKFCPDCGSNSFYTTYEEYHLAGKIKFCSACGAKNNTEDKFCTECGSTQFVPTKDDYVALVAKREEEENRQQKLRSVCKIQNGVLVKYTGNGGAVEIPAGVIKIGENAFYECRSLTHIKIPNSVTIIGDGAFCYCKSLVNITIPDSVTIIGDGAFCYCKSLVNITIPDSVTIIGDDAFRGCESLTSIIIPDSVTSIGNKAFGYCISLTSITVSSGNTTYKSIDGNLYSYDGKTLIQYSVGKTDTSFTIPDSVTSIGNFAFCYCKSLVNITIPDSVTIIGDGAFGGCHSLKSITIPDSVTKIGDGAFNGCYSLKSITIGSGVTTIGDGAFYSCTALTEINFNATAMEDLSLNNEPFLCVGESGDGITVTIGANVKKIPAHLFDIYNDDGKGLINEHVNLKITSVIFGKNSKCESIGDSAFYRCESLTSITIPDSVTFIDAWAFGGCESLASVTIGKSVTTIEKNVFNDCKNLKFIYCRTKKPLLVSAPKGWDKDWLGDDYRKCTAKVIWNYKGILRKLKNL